MKHSLDHDDNVRQKVLESNLKKLKKNKYWYRGWKDAKEGKNRKENPYTLSASILELLRKRTFWYYGWEEKIYSRFDRDERIKKRKKEDHKEQKKEAKRAERFAEKLAKKKERKKHKHHA